MMTPPGLCPTLVRPEMFNSRVYQVAHPSTHSIIKRFIDIVGSIVGLVILSMVFLPIAIAIKLDSPGPIFYTQERCGLQGKPFKIRKFRSMVSNAEALKSRVKNEAKGLIFKNENDPRVTRVGNFLRKTSLDELPQFWNVLKGEMSLVGTRPPTFDEVSQYKEHHWRRLDVKPGITGLWQVSGRSSIKDFEEVVGLDLNYQRNWHPIYDIYLILKTIEVVLLRKGAY
ncbi:sugar transferase [Aerosakkonemataceae cyanobacterium BLCC-F154]|uniref:Sugar transferase n=1 Tax=Floridaenema fluviatile BLCC-F154 TaxID=3153640 RepID=A0ABV4YAF9_9CYAN